MATWNNGASPALVNPDGVVPIPEDYLTALQFDFVNTPDLGTTWEFLTSETDVIRMPSQFLTPLSAGQMSELGMDGP